MTQKFMHLDAAQSVFFARELEDIKAKTYDVVYPELKGKQLVPPSASPAPAGAQFITYRQFDMAGAAKMIASYSDDLPRVDVFGNEFTSRVRELGVSYGYNLSEIEAAAMANRPLAADRARMARMAIEELLDQIIATGDSLTGLVGFLNNPNVPQASVATVSSATTFQQKLAVDPDLVVDDITDMIADQIELTRGREQIDTIAMPPGQLARLNTTRLVDQPVTVLSFLKNTFPGITFVDWYRLTGAGSGGTDRMVGYKRSADKLFYEVPLEFQALDVQERNLEFVVPCRAKSGGVIIPYPLSVSYRDGI